MNNYLNSFLEDYVNSLYYNQNVGAGESQRNLYSRADYYEFLRPVLEVIKENKDATPEELKEILFQRSGLKEAVETLVYKKSLTPGLVLSYGTPDYKETIVAGKRQEVTMDNNGDIKNDAQDMTEDTIFDLASVTKIFTCISVLKLVEKGIIDINANITRYAPEFVNLNGVTVFDLLSFRVPLMTNGRLDTQNSRADAENVLFDIRVNENFNPDANPYTDMGAMVLKYVIERATGMNYYDFLNSEVLLPMGMSNTLVQIPDRKIEIVASTNLDSKIYKDGRHALTTEAQKGVAYDAKARIMGQPNGNLSGHAGLFSTAGDMTTLAKGLINGQVLSDTSVSEIGRNRTGHLKSDGVNYIQHLGYLTYSKYPKQSDSEVWLGLSGKTFASPGWLGNQFTVDPANGLYTFMGANRSHNRVTYVDPTIRPTVEVDEGDKKMIILPNGERKIDASKFAWSKDSVKIPASMLVLQYKMLDDILGYSRDRETSVTRNV